MWMRPHRNPHILGEISYFKEAISRDDLLSRVNMRSCGFPTPRLPIIWGWRSIQGACSRFLPSVFQSCLQLDFHLTCEEPLSLCYSRRVEITSHCHKGERIREIFDEDVFPLS